MTRQEIMEQLNEEMDKLKCLFEKTGVSLENIKYFIEQLEDEKEDKEKNITLADFLGWEEDVEYKVDNEIMKITQRGLELYDDDEEQFYVCEYFLSENNIEALKHAQKIKKKAYHVKDEYSLRELIKELKEKGALVDIDLIDYFQAGFIYFFVDDENYINCYRDIRFLKDYDLIEYHKEEPKYYARYKGSINLYQDYNYYNYLDSKGVCVISDKGEVFKSIIKMTKKEWNELGINENNADFEEVEE